jgi:hypothetical protein
MWKNKILRHDFIVIEKLFISNKCLLIFHKITFDHPVTNIPFGLFFLNKLPRSTDASIHEQQHTHKKKEIMLL